MSAHSELFAATGLGVLLDQLGDSGRVVYQVNAHTSVTPDSVIVGPEQVETVPHDNGLDVLHTRILRVRTADLPDPRTKATVLVDGVAYAVAGIRPLDAAHATLKISRRVSQEMTRGDFRRRD